VVLVATGIYEKKAESAIIIHSFQFSILWRDYKANKEKIILLLKESTAHISVFPEAAVSGFPYDELEIISVINQNLLYEAQAICRSHKKSVVLPCLIKENDLFYNRIFFINSNGQINTSYDKIHLIGALHEDQYLTPGHRIVTADFFLPDNPDLIYRIGLATCYDLRFPELFRLLTLSHKADLIILPAFWPKVRREHFFALAQARSIENQIPFITSNASGRWGKMDLCGDSAAFNAKGECVSKLDDKTEGKVIFEWYPDFTSQWRESFPALKDAKILSAPSDFT
jgi:predicted amidohydrolase